MKVNFDALMDALKLPRGLPEQTFHPTRRWRFDYCWPDRKVAVELDGGAYTRGRHVRGKGFEDDLEKINHALLLGWRVFRFTPRQLHKNTHGAYDVLASALSGKC